jgi:hypothetical protein
MGIVAGVFMSIFAIILGSIWNDDLSTMSREFKFVASLVMGLVGIMCLLVTGWNAEAVNLYNIQHTESTEDLLNKQQAIAQSDQVESVKVPKEFVEDLLHSGS